MKATEVEYLNNLPLVLHFPSYHLFIVHAGILPLNPTIPLSSKHQPLSHVPGSLRIKGDKSYHRQGHKIRGANPIGDVEERDDQLVERDSLEEREWLEERDPAGAFRHRKPRNKHDLRTIQEQLLLTTIPQNTIPFNLLNMRSLERNQPTRAKKGRPWSEVWNDVLDKCVGFPDDAVEVALTEEGRPPVKGPGMSSSRKALFLQELTIELDGEERDLEWWESLIYGGGEVIDWDPLSKHLTFLSLPTMVHENISD